MINIALTGRCNRSCACCFARGVLGPDDAPMIEEVFTRALALLERSRSPEVRLLGGEPTLHPDFCSFVELALARRFAVVVFSNGRMPKESLDLLAQLPPERLTVVLHVEPSSPFEGEAVLARLGPRAMLGVNLTTEPTPFQPLLRLAVDHRTKRSVRVGLCHPSATGTNRCLPPRSYAAVGARLEGLMREAKPLGIQIRFDCGFVPCMFPGDLALGSTLTKSCGPVLDLLPSGNFVSCFPLARELGTVPLADHETVAPLREEFERRRARFDRIGIFRRCSQCRHKRTENCRGGCLAMALRAAHGDGPQEGPIGEREPRGGGGSMA